MKKIILVLVLIFTVIAAAQENWGPADMLMFHSGGDIGTANPSFYSEDSVYIETHGFEEYYYKIYGISSFHESEPGEIPGDSVNIPDVHNISPFVSYDNSKLYFASNRPGGYGGLDIWVSTRMRQTWSIPENLGPGINTEDDEFGASLPLDNQTLYFTRNSDSWEGWMPPEDGVIYVSNYENETWQTAQALPQPININNKAWEPSITADGQKLYFCGNRPENPSYYFAYVSHKNGSDWSEPEALNDNINQLIWCPWDSSYWGHVVSVAADITGTRMVFTYWPGSDCPEVLINISEMTIDVEDDELLPSNIHYLCYPNPFNAAVNFNLSLAVSSVVNLSIYDICGRKVDEVYAGNMPAGMHNFLWKPSNLSSGMYFSRFSCDGFSSTKKLIYLK